MGFKNLFSSVFQRRKPVDEMIKILIEIEYLKHRYEISDENDQDEIHRELLGLYAQLPVSDMIEFISEAGRTKSKDIHPEYA